MKTPRPLARRIDRLARRAHAFHRFAHHPLCDRYREELVPFTGQARLCRGCSLALLGLFSGAALGFGLGSPTVWMAVGALALAGAVGEWLLARRPPSNSLPRAEPRLPKALTRLLPALLLGAWATSSPRWAFLPLGLVAGALLIYRRRGPERSPCQGCPQRSLEVCLGFAAIVRRERAFRRLAGRWLEEAHSGEFETKTRVNLRVPAPSTRAKASSVP